MGGSPLSVWLTQRPLPQFDKSLHPTEIPCHFGSDIVRNFNMSQSLKLEAPWAEVREKLKEIRLDLTDEDLEYSPGQEEELLKRLSARMKKDIPAVKAWIESVSFNKGKAS